MSQPDERRAWVLWAVDEYEVRLVRYALRLVGDLDLARDAVQHAFLKLCDEKVAGTLRVPSAADDDSLSGDGTRSVPPTLAPWLFRVCRNRCVDHLRQAGREQSLTGFAIQDEASPTSRLAGREVDPADAAETGELAACLRELVCDLPLPQREALDLWCEGFAYRQIGEITGRQEGHVRVLVHRGLTRLREHPQVRGWLVEDRVGAVGNALRGVP